jgi:hypothetical protein
MALTPVENLLGAFSQRDVPPWGAMGTNVVSFLFHVNERIDGVVAIGTRTGAMPASDIVSRVHSGCRAGGTA